MPPRLSLKPDASFFRKIALGAVGARSVVRHLNSRGHAISELERGSTDTKLWKEVKRKRVRIPDLVCCSCGMRVESRAKANVDLSMSHSPDNAERAWDFGMVDSDVIAFPICPSLGERFWSMGKLGRSGVSYWHERNWVQWETTGYINYFATSAFRSVAPSKSSVKGVTEGSETSVSWGAVFSSRDGLVERVDGQKITIRRGTDGHRYTWTAPTGVPVLVTVGQEVSCNQVISSAVTPCSRAELECRGGLPDGHIHALVESRERTQRFTGVKLARLRRDWSFVDIIGELEQDPEEDVYIRLEAASYLASAGAAAGHEVFGPYLTSKDEQTQLEAVIAIGETETAEAIGLLGRILDDTSAPYFIRSAAAWGLGRTHDTAACRRLVQAFDDVDTNIREEALEGLVGVGGPALPYLLEGLEAARSDVAAGCAEALRQQQGTLDESVLDALANELRKSAPAPWAVWLTGYLRRDLLAGAVAELQDSSPELHYAISLLWSFMESWISRRWELRPDPTFPPAGGAHDVPA